MNATEFAERLRTLTVRERLTLRLRCEGLQNKEIADRCFVSHLTVKNHLSHVFRKLGQDGSGNLGGGSRSAVVCYHLGRYDEAAERESERAA